MSCEVDSKWQPIKICIRLQVTDKTDFDILKAMWDIIYWLHLFCPWFVITFKVSNVLKLFWCHVTSAALIKAFYGDALSGTNQLFQRFFKGLVLLCSWKETGNVGREWGMTWTVKQQGQGLYNNRCHLKHERGQLNLW